MTSTVLESEAKAMCRAQGCDWIGDVPAVARCPKCRGTYLARVSAKDLASARLAELLGRTAVELRVEARKHRDEARGWLLKHLVRDITRSLVRYRRVQEQR